MSLIRQCLTTTGPKKVVCVLDGGGVRSIFSLELLQLLSVEEKKPLSGMFQMLVGVSAGAMIATLIALGLLDDPMTMNANAASFCQDLPTMFSDKTRFGPLSTSKYKGIGKREVLKRILGNKKFSDVKTPLVILCCTVQGKPVIFKSWDPAHKDVLLCDVLDATSAAHTYFPPVLVGDEWMADGGIVSNKPLIVALLTSVDFFDRANIFFLSLGTMFVHKRQFDKNKVYKMGVLGWLSQGLVEILLGSEDTTSEILLQSMFGERFMRISCTCQDIRLDDHSLESQAKLKATASAMFQATRDKLHDFVSNSQRPHSDDNGGQNHCAVQE
jgi:patatin-like phospholipase/acyl hydrolase